MALHDDDTGRGASLEAVLAELKRGKAVPCYLLYGEEEFRLRDALDKITATLIPDARDRELNLFVTDGEHEDVGSLCESLITPPLLPGRKVVVVRETRFFPSKTILAPLIAWIREGEREEQVDLVSQHPYVVYQSLKNAGRFTRSELAGSLEMLVRIDLALKSTGQEPRLLLERFLLAVCGAVKVS